MNLNNDVIIRIGSYLDPRDVFSMTLVCTQINDNRNQLIENQYKKVFGELKTDYQPNIKIMARLLCRADKHTESEADYNTYKAPSSCLERWKWILGFENQLDKEVRECYDSTINLLENTQAESIIQLKNQHKGVWFANRQISDYKNFKAKEQAQAQIRLIDRIFFACIKFIFKFYYRPLHSQGLSVHSLEEISKKKFAHIGKFSLDGQDYDVVAFHRFKERKEFSSDSYGKTNIGFLKKEQATFLNALTYTGIKHNFSVLIGWERADRRTWISNKENSSDLLLKGNRYLVVDNCIEYRDRTANPEGSDRLLDQKLTQIMVEMAMQNKEISSVNVYSTRDELTVLTAGGFKSKWTRQIRETLNKFRSEEGHKLFPPSKDYGGADTAFRVSDYSKNIVSYSKGENKSWSEIIQQAPILKPNAGVLPEYWSQPPNFID